MQTIQRILTALWSALLRALRFWARDIAKRRTLAGKALSGCLGIFVILCACSMGLAAARGVGEAVGMLPTRTPAPAPTARPPAPATPLVAAAPTPRVVVTTPATTAAEAPASPAPTLAPTAAAALTEVSAPTSPSPTGTPASPPGSSQAATGDAPTRPEGLPSATVARAIDGDTMDVTLDGQTVRVRLIGIDTPETVDPRKRVDCFGGQASARAHELLDGQTVFLEDDPSQDSIDRYGRALRAHLDAHQPSMLPLASRCWSSRSYRRTMRLCVCSACLRPCTRTTRAGARMASCRLSRRSSSTR